MRKLIGRILLIFMLLISILVGMFPSLANSTVYYILYVFLICMTGLYIVLKIKSGNFKYNVFFLIVVVLTIIGIGYREEKRAMYAFCFTCILFSYYVFELCDIDEKFLNTVSIIVSISIIPTIIFNGIFNPEIVGGTSFSGRLNPYMYFPYLLIAIYYNKSNKMLSIILKLIFILTFIDIIWSKSRIALISMIFILIMYVIFCKHKRRNQEFIDNKKRKILEILLISVIILQIVIPQMYIWLFENYETELNNFTYELTGKYFFSGRQRVWSRIDDTIEENEKWGTGDVNYDKQLQTPHNEFMNLYYCWGIFVALCTYIYLFIIGRKCIKNITNNVDLIILLSFIGMMISTMFETYIYAAQFFIFNNLLVSYLLNKYKIKKGENENARISECNYTNI